MLTLGALSVAFAYRYSPRRIAQKSEAILETSPQFVSGVSTVLPGPALVGVRFAVEPGRRADTVPVRSVIFGVVLAMIVVMSTVIFGASLNSLVSHPSLYGWNWNFEIDSEFGTGNIPQAHVATLLARDHDVGILEWPRISKLRSLTGWSCRSLASAPVPLSLPRH